MVMAKGKGLFEKEMSFVGHLEELRWHVIRALAAVLIFTIAAFIVAPWIFENIIFADGLSAKPYPCAIIDMPTSSFVSKIGM